MDNYHNFSMLMTNGMNFKNTGDFFACTLATSYHLEHMVPLAIK